MVTLLDLNILVLIFVMDDGVLNGLLLAGFNLSATSSIGKEDIKLYVLIGQVFAPHNV